MHTSSFSMTPLAIMALMAFFGIHAVLGFSTKSLVCDRRHAFLSITTATGILVPSKASARAPGSKDLSEAVIQIQDAAQDLRKLERDWSLYSVIDDEGRAGSTDGARRILGGIAPQAGTAAIEAAKNTPLYRIDVAFVTVRKAALEGEDWADNLDLDEFENLAERILYEVQKMDGNFYSVLFASKGTKMIQEIFDETETLVKQGILDFDKMIGLLKDAGAPGL